MNPKVEKVWGKLTPMRKITYKEIRKLGDELGINVFGRKNFQSKYLYGQKHLKFYTRLCKRCNKYYKIERDEKKNRPKGAGICSTCKKEIYKRWSEQRKIKNKNNWEKRILGVLKNKSKGLTILEVAEELNCSDFPIRRLFKILETEKKIVLYKDKRKEVGDNPIVAEIVTPIK